MAKAAKTQPHLIKAKPAIDNGAISAAATAARCRRFILHRLDVATTPVHRAFEQHPRCGLRIDLRLRGSPNTSVNKTGGPEVKFCGLAVLRMR